MHITWYSYSRVVFSYDFVEELLIKAGFARATRRRYGETAGD